MSEIAADLSRSSTSLVDSDLSRSASSQSLPSLGGSRFDCKFALSLLLCFLFISACIFSLDFYEGWWKMQVERKKEKDGPLIMNENHSADCLIVSVWFGFI